jgi:hypothetical protein
MKTLKNSIKKLTKENENLLKQTLKSKRADTILNLQEEMESQDLVIEILREIIHREKCPEGEENKFEENVNSLIKTCLDSGPKRVRPKSREELRIELKNLNKKIDDLQRIYYKQNPAKRPDFYKEKGENTEEMKICKGKF